MNGCNMKQATATARRHGYLRTWWRDSRATGKRFFLRLGRGRQKPGSFELYWLLSAGVHRVVKCSGFRLLNPKTSVSGVRLLEIAASARASRDVIGAKRSVLPSS